VSKRPEKKSETIEVRVSYSEKLAFMAACQQAGTTASQTIRSYIGDFLNTGIDKSKTGLKARLAILAGVGGLVIISAIVGVVIVDQSGANAFINKKPIVSTRHQLVQYFDQNKDGFIDADDAYSLEGVNAETLIEMIALGDKNIDARLDNNEFASLAKFVLEMPSSKPQDIADTLAGKTVLDKRVLVFPPGLNEQEQRAYLLENGIEKYLNQTDINRIIKMVDVLNTESTNQGQ
jgi:hypothetical protein